MNNKVNEKYLIDANAFIEAYKKFYAFDIVPKYWDVLIENIKNGKIVLIDKIVKEILAGNDDLAEWFNESNLSFYENKTNTTETINKYGEIIRHINQCGYYNQNGIAKWSDVNIADPWLIAYAATNDCMIITFEISSPRSFGSKTSNVKIPDVAKDFNIECNNLYYMLRKLNVKL